jgi:hypothetical protein
LNERLALLQIVLIHATIRNVWTMKEILANEIQRTRVQCDDLLATRSFQILTFCQTLLIHAIITNIWTREGTAVTTRELQRAKLQGLNVLTTVPDQLSALSQTLAIHAGIAKFRTSAGAHTTVVMVSQRSKKKTAPPRPSTAGALLVRSVMTPLIMLVAFVVVVVFL